MTYFSLRKRAPEPEPDEVDEETPADETEETEEEQPAEKTYGPLVTGLLGPGQWLAAHFGTSTAWTVHAVGVWAIAFYGGWIAAGVVLVWLLAVLLFVPREHLERLAARIEGHGTDPDEKAAEDEPLGPGQGLVLWLLDTIGERPGIHVRELYPKMRQLPGQQERTDAHLKALLKAFGVPVHRSLRLGRISGRTGVRRADVEALLPSRGERRVDSVLYAGQGTDSPPVERGGEEGVEHAVRGVVRALRRRLSGAP